MSAGCYTYDGHTLDEALQQVETLTGRRPSLAVVDRGYRGHGAQGTRVLVSGTRRGLTPRLARLLKRRSAIEPEIGHMKAEGRLARCGLKGRSATPSSPSSAAAGTTSARPSPTSGLSWPLSSPVSSRLTPSHTATRLQAGQSGSYSKPTHYSIPRQINLD
jgi:hypothetical protein